MKKITVIMLLMTLAFISAGVTMTGCSSGDSPTTSSTNDPPESDGQPRMPSFRLETLDGGMLSNEDLLGTPTVINFGASWCGPCEYEAPAIKKVSESQTGVRFVGIAVKDSPEAQQQFVDKHGWQFTIAMDYAGTVVTDFQKEALMPRGAIPTTFFIDSAGNIADVYLGPISESDLIRLTSELQEADAAAKDKTGTSAVDTPPAY
ncbi:MAG: TlpA family protein disulfide reductase [Gaiellales bacterium]|nr:MAG: TlpA family protein disulfide reductase [Gaiellales bacterium]